MATTSTISPRSPEGTRLGKLLCAFAGVEWPVRKISVTLDFAICEPPVFEIEKFAKQDTAAQALKDFAEPPESQCVG